MANRPNQGRSTVRVAPGWNAEEPDSSSLTQAALDAIREDILSGELTPNTRLRMQMLRERYDIGASPCGRHCRVWYPTIWFCPCSAGDSWWRRFR